MTDSPGTVVSLDGRRVGKTASLEQTFVETARERGRREAVYAVVGPDSSEEFRRRVGEVCPVVVDGAASGFALILSGDPSEWRGTRLGAG